MTVFKIPEWEDCVWKRVPCGKDECPICGRIKQNRWRNIVKGKNPDDMESVFEDVKNIFKETIALLKADCKRQGIDLDDIGQTNEPEPPKPEEFPLYLKIKEWRDSVFKLATSKGSAFWLATEEAQDLLWYANILTAKTYRQLCNKWEMERDHEYTDADYDHTKKVISESLKIIKKSLLSADNLGNGLKVRFEKSGKALADLESELVEI